MEAPSVAEWARANPAGRDALLALTERAVALQPAAEAAIQRCQPGPEQPAAARRGHGPRRLRSLADHLRALGLKAPVAAEVAGCSTAPGALELPWEAARRRGWAPRWRLVGPATCCGGRSPTAAGRCRTSPPSV